MTNNLVSLPSGMILNMDNVAFVAALPDAANRRKKLRVAFGSMSSGGAAANIQLDQDDSNALIRAIAKLGVDVGALRESTGEKG
jgi:hypothetical protein